ncbi:hypothetical protein [Cyanobium sp. LEGE 06113]|uniref:hypothetical protein n=1 Tax=Cyanobium sp. LEGE 06113 TaxID=1297573 RepID=UPI001D15916A|nr:hypothetical protein [Cyanobium sp. LEGE 06113]
MPKLPEACTTMAEVREGVDALDRELVALLATRFGYMRAAADQADPRSGARRGTQSQRDRRCCGRSRGARAAG